MNNIATAIVKLFAVQMAQRLGMDISNHQLMQISQDTTSHLEEYALNFVTNLSSLNKGMMSMMQENPDDIYSDCYLFTESTNA